MQAASTRALLAGIKLPFPGLRPFEHDEEAIFRGRRQHTAELLRRLAEHRFLAVVGSSGSGKSSLVRAGLRPALDRGYLPGATSRWRFAVMRPGMAPLENLAESLRQPEALGAGNAAILRSSSLGLVETIRAARLAPGESLLVITDQFEEIFHYQRSAGARDVARDASGEALHFVNLLLNAVARPDTPVYVVLTMRSDFLGDCAQFPGLPEALTASQYLIPRLTREERRHAIEQPLRLFGASVTPQLVERLLNDSGSDLSVEEKGVQYRGGAPDPLPLLQHALLRTWNEWQKRTGADSNLPIDLIDYQAAGRIDSALDFHAQSIYDNQLDDAGRAWAERIFRCLTTTELGRPVRRATRESDLYQVIGARPEDTSAVDHVLQIFAESENSLIRIYGDSTVDIMHESLIWKWKRLRGWVAEESVSADLYHDLMKDATSAMAAVWSDPKLSWALGLRRREAWNESWARQYSEQPFKKIEDFLARSSKAARNQRWLRWLVGAATVALLILGIVAYQKQRELAATASARDSLAKDVESRKRSEKGLADSIAKLNSNQGATQQQRDGIAKQKADLEAQLAKSQQDTQKLSAQAQQSTDLLSTVKGLQTSLEQAQRERDAAVQARTAAEAKAAKDLDDARTMADARAAQLQDEINSLTKDLETARASGAHPVQPQSQQPAPPKIDPEAVTAPSPRLGETKVNPKDRLTYVWIPPGTFVMGCSPSDNECLAQERPAHRVILDKGFWIGQTPVTQEAYERVTGKAPSYFKGPLLPVEGVNWNQAQRYCSAVNMRLPTEAEWEYAARAGSAESRYGALDSIAWYSGNSFASTHKVSQKSPNAWGLYDMLGNVWQWTADWYDMVYYASGTAANPRGPAKSTGWRVKRGGYFLSNPNEVRVSLRGVSVQGAGDSSGVRCVGE